MPIYDVECQGCRSVEEIFLHHWNSPTPDCPLCRWPRTRLASRFGVVFSGPITARYNERDRENAHAEGYWAYRKRSSISGQPEPVFIQTWDQRREFMKAEGLEDAPTNCAISKDGKTLQSNGMPGQWNGGGMPSIPSRLAEIIAMPADQIPQAAATATPRMPIDYGIRVEPFIATEDNTAAAERMAADAAACRAEIGK